jgi:hypothetical protein
VFYPFNFPSKAQLPPFDPFCTFSISSADFSFSFPKGRARPPEHKPFTHFPLANPNPDTLESKNKKMLVFDDEVPATTTAAAAGGEAQPEVVKRKPRMGVPVMGMGMGIGSFDPSKVKLRKSSQEATATTEAPPATEQTDFRSLLKKSGQHQQPQQPPQP